MISIRKVHKKNCAVILRYPFIYGIRNYRMNNSQAARDVVPIAGYLIVNDAYVSILKQFCGSVSTLLKSKPSIINFKQFQ